MTVPLLFDRMFSRGPSTCALAPAVHTAEEPCTHPAEKEKKTEPERQTRPTPLSPSHHLTGSTSSWTGQQQHCRDRTNTVRHLKPVPQCEHRLHDSKLEFCVCDYCTTDEINFFMGYRLWNSLSFLFDTKGKNENLPSCTALIKAITWGLEDWILSENWTEKMLHSRSNAFCELQKQIWMITCLLVK